jgi:peptidoglycan-N-acetylglucosamine deacetylase
MRIEDAYMLLYAFIAIIFLLMIFITHQKYVVMRQKRLQGRVRDYVFYKFFDGQALERTFPGKLLFDVFIDIETQVQIEQDVRVHIVDELLKLHFTQRMFKQLKSKSSYRRRIAIYYVSHIKTNESIEALKHAYVNEKHLSVKLYLAYYMMPYIDELLFSHMITSLESSSDQYQRWMRVVFKNHYKYIQRFMDIEHMTLSTEVIHLLLDIADEQLEERFKHFTIKVLNDDTLTHELRRKASDVLLKQYPQILYHESYLKHKEIWIQKKAILALSSMKDPDIMATLLRLSESPDLEQEVIQSMTQLIAEDKEHLSTLMKIFKQTKIIQVKKTIIRILSEKIDYLVLKLKGQAYDDVIPMLEMMIGLHIVEDLIDFVNKNKDDALEQKLMPFMKQSALKDAYVLDQFQIYLRPHILKKMGLNKKNQPTPKKEKTPLEKDKIIWISLWISLGVIGLPLLSFVSNMNEIFVQNIPFHIILITSMNRYLVIYFMSVNIVYLSLLGLSLIGSKQTVDMWDIKNDTFLFEQGLLPSISIIAPAYNEEKSIVESVTSLLNLKYPTYEVIVVNDGSKDQTIDVLIAHFDLERKHPSFKENIETKPLLGVYVNKNIPNLTVIDKQNGGKADALNMGINVAKYDYICGIDADSILEEDALLKLTSPTLDEPIDFIALGGNIVPVNGCIVDRGKIEQLGLGKKGIVRYQTIEYLRAFTTGRIGWSKLNSLLIISGAFGLFQRKSLIKTGGYLTISGALKKDTVGEDMELVVRLTYQALKDRKKYRVKYIHLANCYTELPSDMHSLLKQRNRWQRGLLDILSYHRRMIFNPRFKQPGLIGFPYFFLFEMIGPFIEFMGYVAVIFGFIFGLLNTSLVILLFIATILFGIVISLFSLLISEKRQVFYSFKETLLLIFVCIIENFGYRQIVSLHRMISTFLH